MLLGLVIFGLTGMRALAQTSSPPPPCPRFPAGSVINEAPGLFSSFGVLSVNLTYTTTVDASGNTLFCFMRGNGTQSASLHGHPGDTIIFTWQNALPPLASRPAALSRDTDVQPAVA